MTITSMKSMTAGSLLWQTTFGRGCSSRTSAKQRCKMNEPEEESKSAYGKGEMTEVEEWRRRRTPA